MNEISKNLMAIVIRGDYQIWIDEENLESVKKAMENKSIIEIGKHIINAVDISGIFSAEIMAEKTRRKNGEWQDEKGVWHLQGDWKCQYKDLYHKKFEKCEHLNSLGYK